MIVCGSLFVRTAITVTAPKVVIGAQPVVAAPAIVPITAIGTPAIVTAPAVVRIFATIGTPAIVAAPAAMFAIFVAPGFHY